MVLFMKTKISHKHDLAFDLHGAAFFSERKREKMFFLLVEGKAL